MGDNFINIVPLKTYIVKMSTEVNEYDINVLSVFEDPRCSVR